MRRQSFSSSKRAGRLLDDLQVAEVAARQIVHNEYNLLGQCLDFIAFGTRQFEYVRVFLVRHDARPRGAVVRQLDETEVCELNRQASKASLLSVPAMPARAKATLRSIFPRPIWA